MPPLSPKGKALYQTAPPEPVAVSPPPALPSLQEDWTFVKRLSVTQGVRGEESPVTVTASTLRSIAVYQIPTGEWATYHIESGTVIVWTRSENDAKLVGEVFQTRFALLLRKHTERIALRDSLPSWVRPWGQRCTVAKAYVTLPEEAADE